MLGLSQRRRGRTGSGRPRPSSARRAARTRREADRQRREVLTDAPSGSGRRRRGLGRPRRERLAVEARSGTCTFSPALEAHAREAQCLCELSGLTTSAAERSARVDRAGDDRPDQHIEAAVACRRLGRLGNVQLPDAQSRHSNADGPWRIGHIASPRPSQSQQRRGVRVSTPPEEELVHDHAARRLRMRSEDAQERISPRGVKLAEQSNLKARHDFASLPTREERTASSVGNVGVRAWTSKGWHGEQRQRRHTQPREDRPERRSSLSRASPRRIRESSALLDPSQTAS